MRNGAGHDFPADAGKALDTGQELRPQEKAGSRRAPKRGRRHTGEVDPGMIHRHAPPRLPTAGPDRMHRGTVVWRECRDAGPACQQECCLSGRRWPSAASWDSTVFRVHPAESQTAPRLQPESRDQGHPRDCILVTPSAIGWRKTSGTWRRNSGRSSRKRTPWWASDTSPGIGTWPPPISPTPEIV